MPGGWRVLVSAVLLAAVLPLPSATGGPAFPAPANPASIDLDPWFVGDRWTHTTRAITRSPNDTYTDSTLVVETRVVGVRSEIVGPRTYTVYNATTTGTVASQGTIPVPSFGLRPFTLTGTSSGWVWSDRSDLATVRTNQTGSASGSVSMPFPFPPAPFTATLATTVTFSPAAEDYDFPLETGDAWSYDVTQTSSGFATFRIQTPLGTFQNTTDLSGTAAARASFWFNRTEDVAVPVGTFPGAARIVSLMAGGMRSERWYHPSAKNLVRMEAHEVNGPDNYTHVWTNLTAMTLMSSPWPGNLVLTPQRVDPGGWLNASGVTNPDEDVSVRIPAIGAAYAARADGTGAWSVRIRAPFVDDFTPTNADVGSHGVLVEPAAGPAGWDVATVQLLLPDLSADPAELVISPANPLPGALVTMNGTVRAGPRVGVSTAFNVTFTVGGAEVARFAVSGLRAGEARAFTASWTAAPGSHLVALLADPENVVRETNEGNNTATRTVFVAGPDLVPVNLVIEGETTDTYGDPAAVGFVSAPVQGRLGGEVNVTFEAANVGNADAVGPFAVLVVRTQGIRGPPLAPPVLRENVTAVAAGTRAGPWTASWPVPNRPGTYHLNVTVDPDGDVAEAFEGNNTFVVVVNVSGPDYRIAQVSAPAKVSTSTAVAIVATVRNDGALAGDRPAVLSAFLGTGPTPVTNATVPPLAAGEARDVTVVWTSPPTGGVHTVRLLIDAAADLEEMDEGNNEASVVVDVRDRPVTTISWTGPNVTGQRLYVSEATRFVLTAVDRSDEGLTTWYRAGGGPVEYVGPFGLSGDGPRTIAYWSVDNLGGWEPEQFLAVYVDTTPPTVRASVGERVGNRSVVTLTATDDGVGVAYVEVRVDDGTWRRYDGPFPVEGFGPHVVAFRAVDLLGNEGPVETLPWTIPEPAAPSGNLKPYLAAAFAAILLALGLLRRRRGAPWSLVSAPSLAVVFALVEIATGVASLGVAALRVPPYELGLAVDVVILAVGAALVLSVDRRRVEPSDVPEGGSAEEESDAGRDGEV